MTKFEFIDAQGAQPQYIFTVLALASMTQGEKLLIFDPNNHRNLCQGLQFNAFKAILTPKMLDECKSYDNLMITDKLEIDPINFPFANDILLTDHLPLPDYHGRFNKNIVVFGTAGSSVENTDLAREIYKKIKADQHEISFVKYTKSIAKQWLEKIALGQTI